VREIEEIDSTLSAVSVGSIAAAAAAAEEEENKVIIERCVGHFRYSVFAFPEDRCHVRAFFSPIRRKDGYAPLALRVNFRLLKF
jgi:hypothetical protein